MDNPLFGAIGIDTFLMALRSISKGQKGKIDYPSLLEWKDVEFRGDEKNARDIFLRLINQAVEKSTDETREIDIIGDCELVEGMAVFMSCESSDGIITFCRLHVIVAPDGDLINLYDNEYDPAFYYRLDYSLEERGGLFNHPFPHIHTVRDGAPRFPLSLDGSIFPPIVFLEFLMMNFYYDRWLSWALSKYPKSDFYKVPDDELSPEQMVESFKLREQWEQIPKQKRQIFLERIKKSTRDAKIQASERFPKINPDSLELNYF
jgi:hypothetical protein